MLSQETQLRKYLGDKTGVMLALTQNAANINSGSYNPDGVAQVAQFFCREFESLSDHSRAVPLDAQQQQRAQQFRVNPDAPLQVLLLGHLDTVFAQDSSFQNCWREGDRLRGPGVADMKGGIVVMLLALKALRQQNLMKNLGVTVLLTPDEEIGSPLSRGYLQSVAKNHACGLVFEPALEDGTLAGARKGSGNFSITVNGRSAHAGREFFYGRNAVAAAAALAAELAALSHQAEGTSVNIARISGGSAINVVPDAATIEFNVRVQCAQHQDRVMTEIKRLVAAHHANLQCDFTLHGEFHRPPKTIDAAHQKLYDLLTACGDQLHLPITYKATGGCCDGNNLAAAGLPNIDTLGVRGGGIHSDREFLVIESLTERALLTALFLSQLPAILEAR